MDAAAELGRNPISRHHIRPEYGDEQADAGWASGTRLASLNSKAQKGTGENFVFCFQLTTRRIGKFTRLILSLSCM